MEKLPRKKGEEVQYLCKCACGNIKPLGTENLRHTKGGTRSCGCLIGSIETREKQGLAKRHAPFASRFHKLQDIAKRKGRRVEITFEEYVEFTKITKCHYCWTPIDWCPWLRHGNDRGYNIDRKDSSLDYVQGNLVVCCPRCNWGKSNIFTYLEWWGMTEYFRRQHGNSNKDGQSGAGVHGQLGDGTSSEERESRAAEAVDGGREAEASEVAYDLAE